MAKQIPGQLSFFDNETAENDQKRQKMVLNIKKCGSCNHFFSYVSGLGEIYHGTACGKDRPLAVNKQPDDPACEYYEIREEAIDG